MEISHQSQEKGRKFNTHGPFDFVILSEPGLPALRLVRRSFSEVGSPVV